MATQKEKTLGYWLGVVLAILGLVATFAAAVTRISAVEEKANKMPGVEWDMRVMKDVLSRVFPTAYDSAIASEVRKNGQRPQQGEKR